jgi:hypothetical protein
LAHNDAIIFVLDSGFSAGSAADHVFDLDQFDDVVATYMRERRIPGASVAVAKDGKFLISKG